MTYSSIQSNALSPDIINTNVQTLDSIKRLPSQREQLKKVSTEFEAIFITKMLNEMDKTVDREGGIFGSDDKYKDVRLPKILILRLVLQNRFIHRWKNLCQKKFWRKMLMKQALMPL